MTSLLNMSCIAVHTLNRVIGKNNTIPWHLSADLKRFRQITAGHPTLMGRRTFESLTQALPDRRNIVLSRNVEFTAPHCEVVNSLDALYHLIGTEECMVIGGGEIYRQCLPLCKRIYLTLAQVELDGDTFFPRLNQKEWQQNIIGEHPADEKNDYDMVFLELIRSSTAPTNE